jgi:lysophospholipase L1-like esterase
MITFSAAFSRTTRFMLGGSKFRSYFAVCLLMCVSTFASLILSELVVRTIFDPVDYLKAHLVNDDILEYKVRPGSSGHDDWGFRNKSVPVSAEVVAIGDSLTYGLSAPAKNSWPAKLQDLTSKDVYNLSLGGYGPVQYFHLLQSKAFQLRSRVVLIGFYFGNDLSDAYRIAYTKDHWRYLRRSDFEIDNHNSDLMVVNSEFEGENASKVRRRLMGDLRDWLGHHSVLYGMFTFSFGNIFRFVEMKYGHLSSEPNIVVVEDRERDIRTGFTPRRRLRALNLEDPKIREGLRLTVELFRQMNNLCADKGIAFGVVLIPTKETVFAEYIESNDKLKTLVILTELIKKEREVNHLLKRYFQQHNIAHVDVLGDLSKAVPEKRIYPANHDGHPNAEGYAIIAKAVETFLLDFQGSKRNAPFH